MIQSSFTAEQLFCMAKVSGKKRMFGIPDPFRERDTEDKAAFISSISDDLVQSGIAELDFEKGIRICPEYDRFLNFICECDVCMTYHHMESGVFQTLIFWKKNDAFLMAEVIQEQYMLSEMPRIQIQFLLDKILRIDKTSAVRTEPFSVPQMELTKAKRLLLNGSRQGAVRVLRQNGVGQRALQTILTGLEEKATYLGITLVENQNEHPRQSDFIWLHSGDMLLFLKKQIINFKTCTRFEPSVPDQANEQLHEVKEVLLLKKEENNEF